MLTLRSLLLAFIFVCIQPIWAAYDYADAWTVKILAGVPYQTGKSDGVGSAARLGAIGGIAVDDLGTVFVTEPRNHLVRRIASSGSVSTLAGSVRGSKEGTGIAAQLSFPEKIAVDKDGNVFVSETVAPPVGGNGFPGYRIRRITKTGASSTLATGAGVVTSLAVYTSARTRLAFAIQSLDESGYPAVLPVKTVSTTATTSNTATNLLRDGNPVIVTQLAANRKGDLFVAENDGYSRLSGTSWSLIPLPGGGAGGFSVDNRENFFSFQPNQGAGQISGAFYTDESGPVSRTIVAEAYDEYTGGFERAWEGNSLKTKLGWGSLHSVAVSSEGLLYFADMYSTSNGYWKQTAFWEAVANKVFTDLSDLQKLPWQEREALGLPWELLGEVWENSTAILRQAAPFSVQEAGGQWQPLTSGSIPEPLSVYISGDGLAKYQWYRSGTRVVSGGSGNFSSTTAASYTPVISGKIAPGAYTLEISYGANADRFAWISDPFLVSVTETTVFPLRESLASANADNWEQALTSTVNAARPLVTGKTPNGEAALLNALASTGLVLRDLKNSGLLEKLGYEGEANPFKWTLKFFGQIASDARAGDLRSFLLTKLYPALLNADTQLGLITDRYFLAPIPSVPGLFQGFQPDAMVDYGDIQALRGFARAGIWAIKWMESMNTADAATWGDIQTAFDGGKLSLEWLLAKYPALLDASSTGAAAAAESLKQIKAAMDSYVAWSDFVRGPVSTTPGRHSSGSSYLFSLENDSRYDESLFRSELTKFRTGLDKSTAAAISLYDVWGTRTYFGAKPGAPRVVNIKPQAFLGHPAGWRKEASAFGFTKNLASATALTSTQSAANLTLKAIFPDLAPADFTSLQTGLRDAEPGLNEKWHTRWDTEPPVLTIAPIGVNGTIAGGDGFITVTGNVKDGSVVKEVFIRRLAQGFGTEEVSASLGEDAGSVERKRSYTWTASVPVVAGTNTFQAFGVDAFNQVTAAPASGSVVVKIQYPVERDVEGEGTVTLNPPIPSNGLVDGGASIKFQATPKAGWVFRHYEVYVDGAELDRVPTATLDLKITGATRVVPVFEPDPFRFLTGPVTLSGFLPGRYGASTSDIRPSCITLTVNKTGSLSGRIKNGRLTYAFSGQFGPDGLFFFNLPSWPNLRLKLNFDRIYPTLSISEGTEYGELSGSEYEDFINLGQLKTTSLPQSVRINLPIKQNESPEWAVLVGRSPTKGIFEPPGSYDSPEEGASAQVTAGASGIVSVAGVLPSGEKFSGSGRLSSLPWSDTAGPDPENPEQQDVGLLNALIQPVTSNKYAATAMQIVLTPPTESTADSPSQNPLWYGKLSYVTEYWASNNRWKVNPVGVRLSHPFNQGGSRGSGSGYQFLPKSAAGLGHFSVDLPTAAVRLVHPDGNTAVLGLLKWDGSRVSVDTARMSNEAPNFPWMVTTGDGALRIDVNPSTGAFTARVGWQERDPEGWSLGTVAPKTFTGLLFQPNPVWDGETRRQSVWGLGRSADGKVLRILY
jgi:hypothetical protein